MPVSETGRLREKFKGDKSIVLDVVIVRYLLDHLWRPSEPQESGVQRTGSGDRVNVGAVSVSLRRAFKAPEPNEAYRSERS